MENCDKYIRKAKMGFLIFSIPFLFLLLNKLGIISDVFVEEHYGLILIFLLSVLIITSKLSLPYITCLSQYKRKKF